MIMRTVKVKKAIRKVSKVPFDPATLVDSYRDPGGRALSRTANAPFEPPVPMTVVNLRGVVKPSERLRRQAMPKVLQGQDNKPEKLSDWL